MPTTRPRYRVTETEDVERALDIAARADEFLSSVVDESRLAHPLTIAEVIVGAARAARAPYLRDDIHAVGVRQGQPDSDEPLRLAELRARMRLRLPDCCVLSAALATEAPVATLGAALVEAARTLGLERAILS